MKLTQRDILGITISILVILGGISFLIFDYLVNGVFVPTTVWVFVAIVSLGILGATAILKGGARTDYYTMFILGICLIPIGVIFNFTVFWILGVIYIAVGYKHKKQWKTSKLYKIYKKKK